VIRSTDNGTNWTILSNGFTATNNVNALAINSNGHVFAGTYGDGIFRSTDNGDSWSPVLNSTHTVSLAFNSNDILFAGHFLGGGILRSSDNGNTWTEINQGLISS